MASKFIKMSSTDRRSAQALLNGYNARLRAWERQAALLPNIAHMGGTVSFEKYLGFNDLMLGGYSTLEQFRTAINARTTDIQQRINEQRRRFQTREAGRGGRRKRGLLDGQYVYFVIGYNHGNGAMFRGYIAERAPDYVETHYNDWEGVDAIYTEDFV